MRLNIFVSILCVLFLAGCTETQLAAHVAKQLPGTKKSQSKGDFKVGNPYKINGVWYTPKETYNLTETGIASWYGPNFHGKPTANGETFDMYELTAAHRTLQIPSLVRVTNLENGRSLIVRVNDRGPFKRGRIIDLSKRSAELLGFKQKGTAKVRLQVLTQESLHIAEVAKRGMDTRGFEVAMNEGRPLPGQTPARQPAAYQQASAMPAPVERETLPGSSIPGHMKDGHFLPDPVVSQMPVTPTSIYVQAGSFGNQDNALRLAQSLRGHGHTQVFPAVVNGQQFYRVRLGPVGTVDQADRLLASLAHAGHNEAIIIVE